MTETISAAELGRLRAETRGCGQVVHFNNAGASLMPDPVYHAVVSHLDLERTIGGYEAAARASESLQAFYPTFARLLNCDPAEVAFVENATRAWDMAFYAIPFVPGDRVITHASEYASNYLALLHVARCRGIEIDLAPSDGHGQIDVAGLRRMITPRTRAIAITHVPTQSGLVNPVEDVGAIAREHDLLYVLDACQAVGQLEVDVQRIGCDILSGTGRKFLRGPRGTGFLYVNRRLHEELHPPFVDLHAARWTSPSEYVLLEDARRFENWESNVAGRIGLTRAAAYATEIGLRRIERRVEALGALLRASLATVPGLQLHDRGQRRCGIVTFTIDGLPAQDVARALSSRGVNVSVTVSGSALLDLGSRGLDGIVRASAHYYNTEDEVQRLVSEVHALRP